jgi:uncharacterized membrane protein
MNFFLRKSIHFVMRSSLISPSLSLSRRPVSSDLAMESFCNSVATSFEAFFSAHSFPIIDDVSILVIELACSFVTHAFTATASETFEVSLQNI